MYIIYNMYNMYNMYILYVYIYNIDAYITSIPINNQHI